MVHLHSCISGIRYPLGKEYKQWIVSKFDSFVMKNPKREDENDYDEE